MPEYLSSNHFSHDTQVRDVVSWLRCTDAAEINALLDSFPEWDDLVFEGSWLDADASGVDPEYMSWVTDWIEANTNVIWEDGEPVILEEGDFDDEDTGYDYDDEPNERLVAAALLSPPVEDGWSGDYQFSPSRTEFFMNGWPAPTLATFVGTYFEGERLWCALHAGWHTVKYCGATYFECEDEWVWYWDTYASEPYKLQREWERVVQPDPELERLLDEEEEIARRTRPPRSVGAAVNPYLQSDGSYVPPVQLAVAALLVDDMLTDCEDHLALPWSAR